MAYKDTKLQENRGYGGMDIDEDYQERALRLNSLCHIYEQADRVLSGDPVQVIVVDDGPAPAWSDGQSIWINASQIESFDLAELTQINGLNFHELAHHLYTPRKGTELVKWVLDNNYQMAFNLLEDQRIETLLTGRYPAIVPFLQATIIRWLGRTERDMHYNYIAVRGRRYLPVDIRHSFRDMFVMPELIPVIADIVDKYRLLAFNRDYKQAKVLIERFQREVLQKLEMNQRENDFYGQSPMDMDGGPGQCGQRNPTAKGRPDPSKMQERDAQRARGIGQAETPYQPKQPDSSDGGEGEREGDVQDQKSGDGKQSGDGDGTSDSGTPDSGQGAGTGGSNTNIPTLSTTYEELTQEEAEQAREQHVGKDTRATQAGNSHVKSVGGRPSDATKGALKDRLEAALNEIHSRKDVQQDIRTKQRVIIGFDKFEDHDIKRGKYDNIPAKPHVVSAYRRFAQQLERLKQECEPTWQREQPAGRVNVQRWIRGCSIDDAFDRWEEGDDGTDIEAVLLVDRSGSMQGGNDMAASESMWVIKRALDHIGADVSAYAFDHEAEIVYDRKQKAPSTKLPFVFGNGGTNPQQALVAAERLLKSSRRKTKMLFIVTDGDFSPQTNDEIIQRLNSMGVLTVMVLIANDSAWSWYQERKNELENAAHQCRVFRRVDSATALIALAREVVTESIKRSMKVA